MKTVFVVIGTCVVALTATAGAQESWPVWAEANDHPRLFLRPERLKLIRELVERSDTHHQLAFAALKARVDAGPARDRYTASYRAREAAMAALLSDHAAAMKKHAEASFEAFMACDPLGGSGLARSMNSLGMAVAYDWCFNLWDEKQRARAKEKVDAALDAWPDFSHANLGDVRGSNWVAVTRGGELVLLLAAGEEKDRAGRYQFLKRELIRHIQAGFGDLGITQEGIGYTEYPGSFLLPAVFACASLGDEELLEVARTRAWWKSALYTHTFQEHRRKTLQTGVTSGGTLDQGWSSLMLNLCPEDQLPYFLWFYDRHLGKLAQRDPQRRFDSDRAGTVWALVYYPQDVEAKDPTGVFPAAIGDSRGYYFFRNRWKDCNDVQTSIMADAHHHGHAWDQPEQLTVQLLAFNNRFFGGPVKGRDDRLYSTLLVDRRYNVPDAAKLTGAKIDFQPGKTGGYAIVVGGELYRTLGVEDARRHYLVEFSLPDGRAILSTLDRITSRTEHTYTWQGRLGDKLDVQIGQQSGRPFFLLRGRDEGFVEGWVVHPADARIKADGPLRIESSGANAQIWMAMLVGAGRPSAASIEGEGLKANIRIEGKMLSIDQATGRITCRRLPRGRRQGAGDAAETSGGQRPGVDPPWRAQEAVVPDRPAGG